MTTLGKSAGENLGSAFEERFAELPASIQKAIKSADLERHLRALAETHQLHIDQWEVLQDEVNLTLYAFQDPGDLPGNLEKNLGVDRETAGSLAQAINDEIFEPIRQELERELTHPEAQAAEVSDMEKARQAALSAARAAGELAPQTPQKDQGENLAQAVQPTTAKPVQPATPPAAKPEGTVTRAAISDTYKPSQPSTERKDVHSDPYRESPL